MADDDGGFSVWGQEENMNAAQSSRDAVKQIATDKATPRLFDDLDDADWNVQPSSPAEEAFHSPKRHSPMHDDPPIASTSSIPHEAPESLHDVAEMTRQTGAAGFDDFNDEQFMTGDDAMNDDDFGDFGAFDEAEQYQTFDEPAPAQLIQQQAAARSDRPWQPLINIRDVSESDLERSIREILAPPLADGDAYPYHDWAASQLAQTQVRQVEGDGQVLVREESRNAWATLMAEPDLKPLDWMRSSTRRQHLIALGIPINLDEVRISDGNSAKAMPVLSLKVDQIQENGSGRSAPPRNGTPDQSKAKPPTLDIARAKELTSLTEDQLTLLTLPALRDMAREMENLTRQSSDLLTYYLSQRESHNADGEMYNGLIRDLVTGAANRFSSTAGVKRSSTLRKASTNSGRNSPAPSASAR